MSDPLPSSPEEAFLQAFFCPPNGAVLSADGSTWKLLNAPANAAQAQVLSQNCSRVKSRAPAFVPWLQPNVSTWYVIAFAPTQVRTLQQWLRSFIGCTFGTFSELPIALGSGKKPEKLLRSLHPAAVFTIKLTDKDRKHGGDQISRLSRLLEERPDLTLESWDTSASLLRSFFAALAAHNLHAAASALSRLKSGAFLDAVNLSFLEIQLLAAGEQWSSIASHERLRYILPLRRPLRVDSLIADSLYRTHLAGKEQDPDALIAAFKKDVLPLAGSIFARQPAGASANALRCYALWRLASTKDQALIHSAASALPADDPVRCLAEKHLAALRPPVHRAPQFTIQDARTCFDAGDWQGVIQIIPHLVPSPEVLGLAIRAAAEIGTATAAQFASAQWSRHTPTHQDAVLRSRWLASTWSTLSSLSNESAPSFVPATPGAWFSRIAASPDWPQAQTAWDRAVGEWDFRTFATSPDQVQAATDLLAAPLAQLRATLRQVLPQLLSQIPDDLRASRTLQKFHLHSAEFLATTDALSEEERDLLVEASLRALDAGLAQLEYSYLVEECFSDAWKRSSSPRTFPWALSLLEILADRPASPASVRASFAQFVVADAQRYISRLVPNQVLLLRELLAVIQLNELAEALPKALAPQVQSGEAHHLSAGGIRRIGIYTLMEPAARRAQAIIQGAHPAVEVILNADHVATAALQNMARDCDALLVVTSSAKHAATACIEQNRRAQPLLYVNGKGSSSILNAWANLLQILSASS